MKHADLPAGIILAGGQSRRFGRDKASAQLLGVPLLQHVLDRLTGVAADCFVVIRKGQALPPLSGSFSVVEDKYPDAGPLGALCTGLQAIVSEYALCVACDMPLLRPALLSELVRLGAMHTAVVPIHDGQAQPLCASYSKACLPVLLRHLEEGSYRLQEAVAEIPPHYLNAQDWQKLDPRGSSFLNLNREEDLGRLERFLRIATTRPDLPG